MLEEGFKKVYGIALFAHDIDDTAVMQHVTRFVSRNQASLLPLPLAKELVRIFSDRLNVRELRKLATREDKDKIGSNKLLRLSWHKR